MLTVHRTVTTTTPPDRTTAYLADFENATEWDAGTLSCARTRGDGRPGTVYRNVSRFAGREVALDYTVESLTDDGIVLVGRNRTTTSTDRITVRPHGAGSEVDYRAELSLSGPARFVQPVVGLLLERLGDRTAATLRQALDHL